MRAQELELQCLRVHPDRCAAAPAHSHRRPSTTNAIGSLILKAFDVMPRRLERARHRRRQFPGGTGALADEAARDRSQSCTVRASSDRHGVIEGFAAATSPSRVIERN